LSFSTFFLSLANAHADTFGTGANTFTMGFVTIGSPGNAADDTGFGSVGHTYRMGVHEVSRGMINAYNTLSGGPTLTMQDMTSQGGNGVSRPATGISWNEAARFVNWLNTSSGYSAAYKFTTGGFNDNIALWQAGDAGYNAANPFRNTDAHYFLPSEDEWYKAAYYDPNKNGGAGYWNYATASDTLPTAVGSGTTSNTAVYSSQGSPANITTAGGLSAYGTMAQNGNAWEWSESGFDRTNDAAEEERVLRGGGYNNNAGTLLASSRNVSLDPIDTARDVGFRVAAIPEPSGFLMTLIGTLGVLLRRNR
jgi:formylglycine-generating enzyme required for sulfatase activity